KFGNSLVKIVCDPYVLALTGDAEGTSPDLVSSQHCSGKAQLCNGVAEVVHHKNSPANNRYTHRPVADGKRPEVRARSRQFGNTVALAVCDPDVRTVKGQSSRTIAGCVSSGDCPGRWIELHHVVTNQIRHPDRTPCGE